VLAIGLVGDLDEGVDRVGVAGVDVAVPVEPGVVPRLDHVECGHLAGVER